jgi:3-hydroxybutyryl-CoA dehydrogenase
MKAANSPNVKQLIANISKLRGLAATVKSERMVGNLTYFQLEVNTPTVFPELTVSNRDALYSDSLCKDGECKSFPTNGVVPYTVSLAFADRLVAKTLPNCTSVGGYVALGWNPDEVSQVTVASVKAVADPFKMEIKNVGVLGCGLMGSGIAQVCATAGFDVTVLEVEQKFLDKGFAGIEKSLAKFAERPVEKGGITPQQKDETRARLKGTTNKADLADCDIVIEAIIENVEEKKKMYASIDSIVKKDAIFASNTSSISVTELLTSVQRPERFVGLHFFNPVPLMKLVEVVKTIATAPEVYDAAYEFAKKLGKVPVRTSDKTGFIVNRLLVPYLLDAIRAYEEGVGSIEDIDNAMKLGCGYPMGPFTLLDFVGLDTTYYITHVMYDEFKERRFASPPLLKRMVMAGWYGRKSGRGFYDYSDPAKPVAGKF